MKTQPIFVFQIISLAKETWQNQVTMEPFPRAFPSSAFLLGKGRGDGALGCSLGAQPGATDLIQESIYGFYVHIKLKDVSV